MTTLKSTGRAMLGTALALLLFGGAYAGIAYAGQRGFGPPEGGMRMGPGPGGPMGMMMGMMGRELGLTDAQKQQVRSILDQHKGEIAPLEKTARDGREALMDAARTNADDGVLQQKAADLGTAESQLALATAKIQAQIFNQVLTADQQQKALQLRDQMKNRMEQRRQRRSGGGGR